MESIKFYFKVVWHGGLFGILWELVLWVAALIDVLGKDTPGAILMVALIAVNRLARIDEKIEGKSYSAGYRDCATETAATIRTALGK